MANFYDKASLVLIPSGTKESLVFSQKPTNGDGDFTFSRSTSATRVGPSGYIEKETQNLILQSNQFDTTWLVNGVSVTSGQAGYDGTNNAWLLQRNDGLARFLYQLTTTSSVATLSFYVKAGNTDWVYLNTINTTAYFDLTNGVVGIVTGGDRIDSNIESVGNGWYRISITANGIDGVRIYPALGNGVISGASGVNIYIQDAQLEQGLVARDYIETTTSAVYGGITDNIPRLDYTDSSCPSLLLEPQRTNLLAHSEYMTSSNWVGGQTTAAVVLSSNLSPEGKRNCYQVTRSSSSTTQVGTFAGITNGSTYTASIYVKSISGGLSVRLKDVNGISTIKSITTDWTRIDLTSTATSTIGRLYLELISDGDVVEIYGAQLEQGSYATSYIPTYGSAVTRNGAIINTGTSSTNEIGQQSGVIYAEFKAPIEGTSSNWLSLTNGSSTNDWIFIGKDYNKMRSYLRANNVVIFSNSDPLLTGDYQKVALRYDNSNSAIFINGVKIAEYPSATYEFSQTLNRVSFGTPYGTASEKTDWKKVVIFPTALTDEEAIALTTI